eukprot:9343668-Alexandrium_andersonii.AAC.1
MSSAGEPRIWLHRRAPQVRSALSPTMSSTSSSALRCTSELRVKLHFGSTPNSTLRTTLGTVWALR